MKVHNLLYVLLTLSHLVSSASFYDNPDQDPLPPGDPSSTEELHRKWDFEVCLLLLTAS